MLFDFLSPKEVDIKMFYRCVDILSNQSTTQLHFTNELCLRKYKKTVNQFLSYLISIGEYYEEYEACSKLIIQQKKYNKWINTNLEIVENISKLLNGLSNRKI